LGDRKIVSWSPGLELTHVYVYRGVATYGNPLLPARTAGHGVQYFADEPVVIECADFGDARWKPVALYDGAKRIAAIGRDKPRVALKLQKLGVHAGVPIGERPDGSLRTSWPVAWVVRPAPVELLLDAERAEGFSLTARRAGRYEAASPAHAKVGNTPAYVMGSSGLRTRRHGRF
jgi:hypothetical protein